MNDKILQDIIDKLEELLPGGWKKVILFVGYTVGSYSMKYYTDNGNGQYVDCFSQNGVDKAHLIKLFMEIDRIISQERKNLDDKSKWTVMTMMVNSDGRMKTEYDYTDISKNAIAYEHSWKEKYL